MEDWNQSGIYMLTCRINGKKYIGQSINISRRLKEHEYESKINRDHVLIHEAVRKYGWENFDKSVLEFCPIEKLDELEIYYITKLSPEYNLAKGGGAGARGYKHSEESKNKISKVLVGNQYGAKKIVNVETGRIFNSIKLAATSVGKTRDVIWRALYGRIQTAGGYHWKFLDDYNENEIICDEKPHRKSVMCIETGEIFESMKAAADSVGLKNPASISQIFYGKAKSAGGYHWKFFEKETDKND